MFRLILQFLLLSLPCLPLACAEKALEAEKKGETLIARLDAVFAALECSSGPGTETLSSSQLEFARMEAVRAKVDAAAAFRSAHALNIAASCAPEETGLREEAAQAYRIFRSRIAHSALGASRTRALGDLESERAYLGDLIELLGAVLPQDAKRAERRVRQIEEATRLR